jgi:hypothetical protein
VNAPVKYAVKENERRLVDNPPDQIKGSED